MDAVERYKQRRAERIAKRFDEEAEENNNNNVAKTGSHGNTRLPFGLCKRYGIDVQNGWTPSDAWNALAEKGVTPKEEYAKLGKKADGGSIKIGGTTFSNLDMSYNPFLKRYEISGDYEYDDKSAKKFGDRSSISTRFSSKEQAIAFLRDNGVTRYKDADTGETINPQKVDLPRTVATVKRQPYKSIRLGLKQDKYGHPFDGKGFTVTGIEMDGTRTPLEVFDTYKEVRDYLKKIGCAEEDAKMSSYLKKHLTPKA